MKLSPDNVSLNIFDQVDSICREFRGEWKQGRRPRIEEWVDRVPEPAQANLFHRPLYAELNCRQRMSERASSVEHLQRLPPL